jgi:flagellar hook-associated protein 1 FlgK
VSDFAGLRLALSALQAQRRGVETAAQNAANSNTVGYSRQRVDLESVGAPAVPALFSRYEGSGGGVRVAAITRYRDEFLELRAALEHATASSLSQQATSMKRVEQLFNEPSDDGIAKQLSEFWAAWDDIANHPEEPAPRTQLLERAQTVLRSLNATSANLSQLRQDTIAELNATVADINGMATSIAELNKAIKANTVAGLSANELMDTRDLLANKLAAASGGTVRNFEYGQVSVVINGTALVQENHTNHLTVDSSGSPVVLRWAVGGAAADVTSGTAGGKLNVINSTVPAYIARMDAVATTLRDQVNGVHAAMGGDIADGSQDLSTAGNLTFRVALNTGAFQTVTIAGADWSGAGGAAALQTAMQNAINAAIGAGNATVTVTGGNGSALAIGVAPTGTNAMRVQADGTNTGFATLLSDTGIGSDGVGGRAFFTGTSAADLALASGVAGNPSAVAAGRAGFGPLDGGRALDLAELAGDLNGADASYRQVVVQLGVEVQTTSNRNDIQTKAVAALDGARAQVSGVNLDEEMTALVQFQHAYEAAARFLSAVDEMLDTLINRTAV